MLLVMRLLLRTAFCLDVAVKFSRRKCRGFRQKTYTSACWSDALSVCRTLLRPLRSTADHISYQAFVSPSWQPPVELTCRQWCHLEGKGCSVTYYITKNNP